MRPIDSTVGTLARCLAVHVKNNVEFKNKLLKFALVNDIPDFKLISLDVETLLPKISLETLLDFVERIILVNTFSTTIPYEKFRVLIKVCTENNYFARDDGIYQQIFGIVANLYLKYVETKILPNCNSQTLFWLRYIDVVFVVWLDNQKFSRLYHPT